MDEVAGRRAVWRVEVPCADRGRPGVLYARGAAGARRVLDGVIELGAGNELSFDTYFGGFGIGAWHRHTMLRDLAVTATVRGGLQLDVVHRRPGRPPTTVASREVDAARPTLEVLEVPDLDQLREGALHLRAHCRAGTASLGGIAWCTRDAPPREVDLGVVITTYHRPGPVRANLTRLATAVAERRDPAGRLRVVVVDNGRDLVLDPLPGLDVTVIANRNLGGSGGFARGLMHLRDTGDVSHVLFMDDDVDFDAEILFRARELLSYARDPRLCVAGAMLATERPTELFEAGARFRGRAPNPNRALGQGVDLADPDALLTIDVAGEPVDYGAWWCFAFPIDLTADYPFPTFVRGDDVLWGLLHTAGRTVACNGIGLWHEGFERKNGPHAWFYESRNFALAGVLAVPRYRWWHLASRYVNLCARSLFSLKYASAANITFGVREFLAGPGHWRDVDQEALDRQVRGFEGERVAPLADELRRLEALPRPRGLARVTGAAFTLLTL